MLVVLPAYVQGHFGGALFVSAVALFLCGLRGFTLFFGAVLGWFSVIALDMFLIRTLFPTPVRARRTDDQKDLILKLKP
jgi:hypothetical protein